MGDNFYTGSETVPPLTIVLFESIVGNLGNFCLVYITIRSKNLHSITNIFIALNAACDLVTHFANYSLVYYKISGLNGAKRQTCCKIKIILCLNAGMFMTLCIGIDRLLNVISPSKYRLINSSSYISVVVLLTAGYSCIWVLLSWHVTMATNTYSYNFQKYIRTADEYVACNIADFIPYSMMNIWGMVCIILSALIGVVYMLIWIMIRKNKSQSNATGRMLKSLTIITIIILLTFPISMILYYISVYIFAPENVSVFNQWVACLQNFGMACNFYIYFLFSKDYRRASQRYLPFCKYVLRRDSVKVAAISRNRLYNKTKPDGFSFHCYDSMEFNLFLFLTWILVVLMSKFRGQDPYKILGLKKEFSQNELEERYKKLVKLHQPELGGDPNLFKQIKSAYKILKEKKNGKTLSVEQHKSNEKKTNDPNFDPFKVLGVSKEAGIKQIEHQYKRLIQIHQPELGGSQQVFDDIKRAYKIISNGERRRKIERIPSTRVCGVIILVTFLLCYNLPHRPAGAVPERRSRAEREHWTFEREVQWNTNAEPINVVNLLASLLVDNFHVWTAPVPASQAFIDSLPFIQCNSQQLEIECPICLEIYGENRRKLMTRLECGHMFHRDCTIDWLLNSNTCPYCRHPVPTDYPLYLEYMRLLAEREAREEEEEVQHEVGVEDINLEEHPLIN